MFEKDLNFLHIGVQSRFQTRTELYNFNAQELKIVFNDEHQGIFENYFRNFKFLYTV